MTTTAIDDDDDNDDKDDDEDASDHNSSHKELWPDSITQVVLVTCEEVSDVAAEG